MNIQNNFDSNESFEPFWLDMMNCLNADHARGRAAARIARDFIVAERSAAYAFKLHHFKQLREREQAIREMVAEEDRRELEDLFITFDSERMTREQKGALLLELMIRRQEFKPLRF